MFFFLIDVCYHWIITDFPLFGNFDFVVVAISPGFGFDLIWVNVGLDDWNVVEKV